MFDAHATVIALVATLATGPSAEPDHGVQPDAAAPPDGSTDASPDPAPTPDAEPVTEPDPPPPDLDAGPEAALDRLTRAQLLRGEGDYDAALIEVDRALELDPNLSSGYLARAQIRVEAADGLTEAGSEVARAELLEAAATDLELYLGLSELGPEATVGLTSRRDELRAQAKALREPSPPPAERPRPTQATPPVDRKTRRPGAVALVTLGSIAAAAGTGLAVGGLRIERTCDALCSIEFATRPALFAPAVSSSLVGAGLVTGGVVALADARKPARRAGIVALSLAGVFVVAGTTTAAIVGAQWGDVEPRDDDRLTRVQRTANASLALWMPVPTLIGAGTAALIRARPGARRRDRRARRRPFQGVSAAPWAAPTGGGVMARGRF